MRNVFIIMKREIFASTTGKSFLIATIFWPLLFSILGIFFLRPSSEKPDAQEQPKTVQVASDNSQIVEKLNESKNVTYVYAGALADKAQSDFLNSNHFALLAIPPGFQQDEHLIRLYTKQNELDKVVLGHIERDLLRVTLTDRFKNIPTGDSTLTAGLPDIALEPINLYENSPAGKEMRTREFLSLYFAISIFFLLLFWTKEIMNRVLEEKSNRIVEVIMTSVRSFDLVLGKILGFICVEASRIAIGIIIVVILLPFYEFPVSPQSTGAADHSFFAGISTLEGVTMSVLYLFFLIFGFLLYSSVFAAIGAAVDSENEAVPFQIPVWAMLLISLFLVTSFHQPHNTLAQWASIIPFTSPIVMAMRLPFGVPGWQIALSMVVLFSTFLLMVFAAGKIYRLGVLLHGAKPNFSTIGKWLFK